MNSCNNSRNLANSRPQVNDTQIKYKTWRVFSPVFDIITNFLQHWHFWIKNPILDVLQIILTHFSFIFGKGVHQIIERVQILSCVNVSSIVQVLNIVLVGPKGTSTPMLYANLSIGPNNVAAHSFSWMKYSNLYWPNPEKPKSAVKYVLSDFIWG